MSDEQQILKTRLAFCGYCSGCGFILVNTPIYKKETSPVYITCWQCKGIGLRHYWNKTRRSAIYEPQLKRKRDLTAEQIRALSVKNLRYLYCEKRIYNIIFNGYKLMIFSCNNPVYELVL